MTIFCWRWRINLQKEKQSKVKLLIFAPFACALFSIIIINIIMQKFLHKKGSSSQIVYHEWDSTYSACCTALRALPWWVLSWLLSNRKRQKRNGIHAWSAQCKFVHIIKRLRSAASVQSYAEDCGEDRLQNQNKLAKNNKSNGNSFALWCLEKY